MLDLVGTIIKRAPRHVWSVLLIVIASSLLASAILVGVGAYDWRYFLGKSEHLIDNPVSGYIQYDVIVALLIALFLVSAIYWMVIEKSKEDELTPLRKRLVGKWWLEASNYKGKEAVEFQIDDEYKKLILIIDWPAGEKHEAFRKTVYDISLNPRIQPNTLMYFVALELVERAAADGGTPGAVTHRQFFVKVDLNRKDNSINDLSGTWYELTSVTDDQPRSGSIRFTRAT